MRERARERERGEIEIEKERERERQTDRQTDNTLTVYASILPMSNQTPCLIDIHTYIHRQTDRQKHTHTGRQTDTTHLEVVEHRCALFSPVQPSGPTQYDVPIEIPTEK